MADPPVAGHNDLAKLNSISRLSMKVLLSWQIVSVHLPSHSYQSFFDSEVKPKCPDHCQMNQVHVGKTKEALSLIIVDVTSVFGYFI